jgi:hypothetical protein
MPLFAIGVDSRFDYFPSVRRFDDLAFLRHVASQLRKAKQRSVTAGDRDLPRWPSEPCVGEAAAVTSAWVGSGAALAGAPVVSELVSRCLDVRPPPAKFAPE